MAGEKEFLIAGGGSTAVQMDALDDFAGSAESGVTVRIRSKSYAPFGPQGEGVCKAILVTVRHDRGCALKVTPVVDELLQPENTMHFSRPIPGEKPGRGSFRLPLAEYAEDGSFSTGQRGTTFGVEFEVPMPRASFHIESLTFELIALNMARGREVGDE